MRTCYTGEVSKEHLDQTVTSFGWVHRRRDNGGVIVIDLRDRAGLAQIVVDPDNVEAEIGRAHVWTPVTNAHLVCSLLLEKKKRIVTMAHPQTGKLCHRPALP